MREKHLSLSLFPVPLFLPMHDMTDVAHAMHPIICDMGVPAWVMGLDSAEISTAVIVEPSPIVVGLSCAYQMRPSD